MMELNKPYIKENKKKDVKMKIRMSVNDGQILKYIDMEKKIIREQDQDTLDIIEFNYDGIVKSFGSIENYVDYQVRVWKFKVL